MESELIDTGVTSITLLQNNYAAGDTVTMKYRHGASQAACLAAEWTIYTTYFNSDGFVQIRVESTL